MISQIGLIIDAALASPRGREGAQQHLRAGERGAVLENQDQHPSFPSVLSASPSKLSLLVAL